MKYLCLAYGDKDGWNSLSQEEQQEVLLQDEMIRGRGDLTAAVQAEVTSVRNCDKNIQITERPYAQHDLPLAGFSVIEAESLDEVIDLVSATPCARGRGVIEIRPFWYGPGDES